MLEAAMSSEIVMVDMPGSGKSQVPTTCVQTIVSAFK
jgi:hypothetical protein